MYQIQERELFDDLIAKDYETRELRKAQLVKELETLYRVDSSYRIRFPSDVVPHLTEYRTKDQEHFIVVPLNGAHAVIDVVAVSVGTTNRAVVHPREVFRLAIRTNATAIIIAHNHPSGSLTPSMEDRDVTRQLKKAGDVIGIRLLDHVIVSAQGYYSFLERGEM